MYVTSWASNFGFEVVDNSSGSDSGEDLTPAISASMFELIPSWLSTAIGTGWSLSSMYVASWASNFGFEVADNSPGSDSGEDLASATFTSKFELNWWSMGIVSKAEFGTALFDWTITSGTTASCFSRLNDKAATPIGLSWSSMVFSGLDTAFETDGTFFIGSEFELPNIPESLLNEENDTNDGRLLAGGVGCFTTAAIVVGLDIAGLSNNPNDKRETIDEIGLLLILDTGAMLVDEMSLFKDTGVSTCLTEGAGVETLTTSLDEIFNSFSGSLTVIGSLLRDSSLFSTITSKLQLFIDISIIGVKAVILEE